MPQPITIYHNPRCGTSRNVLALIRESGTEPEIIEYLKTPPERQTLEDLLKKMGISVRELLRTRGTPYEGREQELQPLSDAELITLMAANPILINRPIVVTPTAVRLCRPSETVKELL